MNEIMDMILTLTQDIKTVKAYLLNFHKSRLEQFSEEWIDGQVVQIRCHAVGGCVCACTNEREATETFF